MTVEEEKAKRERMVAVALQYFRQTSGFERLFEGFKEKYASFGYFIGIVQINNIREDEKNALSGFLGRDLSKQKTVAVSAEAFQKALNSSRFDGIRVEELVNAYFYGGLVYKKQIREQEAAAQEAFFQKLLETVNADEKTLQWVQGIIKEKHAPYNQIMQEYHENPQELFKLLSNVMSGISRLPEAASVVSSATAVRLPVFATGVTGEPHYFDKGAKAYTYLLHGIYYRLYGKYMENATLNAEEEAEILYKAGLIKDDLSNFVLCFGMRGYLKTAGESQKSVELRKSVELMESADSTVGYEHRGMEAFFELGEPIMLSLRNLNKLSGAYAVGDKVFVVENPAVFGAVIEANAEGLQRLEADSEGMQGSEADSEEPQLHDADGMTVDRKAGNSGHSQISAVCSAGQPNLAVLVLLDLLAASGAELYYSGDFDPEGLLIADRLKLRYGAQLKLWHFTKDDYSRALSEKPISERRLKQLDKLKSEELRQIGEVMKGIKKAGYQEGLL